MRTFWILWAKYNEMNFPNLSLEESISNWKAKEILDHAMGHLRGQKRYGKSSFTEDFS